MRDRHVEVNGSRLRFRFRGKRGAAHDVEVTDARVARTIRRCRRSLASTSFSTSTITASLRTSSRAM
jgi:DNA topoisomerase-1